MTEIENTMRFRSPGGTPSQPPCEKHRINVLSVWRKENPKILPLFHCLNAPCWMKVGCIFLIPPGHLLTTTRSTRSRSPQSSPRFFFVFSASSRAWRQFHATLARSKQHRRQRCRCPGVADVVLEQKSFAARPPRPELLHRCRSPGGKGSSNCHCS